LTTAEKMRLFSEVKQSIGDKGVVIAGTGTYNTAESIELSQEAEKQGVDGLLLVVPYYNKPPQEGLFQHFNSIAAAVSIPQILYNVPGRTAVDMSNETTLRLAEIDNIVGVKDATNDIDRGCDLIDRSPDGFSIYSGEDGTACQLMLAGGKGTISVTANAAPKLMHEMCVAAVAGDTDTATILNNQLADLHAALFFQSNPIPAKWAVCQQGLIGSGIRLPLIPLAEQYHDDVRAALQKADVL
jgi:4-hydroxy-tetrahydrodipicolinate synthase